MKKLIKILVLPMLLICCGMLFVACGGSANKLSAPQNLSIDASGILTWDAVTYADCDISYEVEVPYSGDSSRYVHFCSTNSYDIYSGVPSYNRTGTITIKVRTVAAAEGQNPYDIIGENLPLRSSWSSIQYTFAE